MYRKPQWHGQSTASHYTHYFFSLVATAATIAAPRPEPSVDSFIVIPFPGSISSIAACMRDLKCGCSLYRDPSTATVHLATFPIFLTRETTPAEVQRNTQPHFNPHWLQLNTAHVYKHICTYMYVCRYVSTYNTTEGYVKDTFRACTHAVHRLGS